MDLRRGERKLDDLADDGYSGSLTGDDGQSPAPGTIIDVQPAWSPDDTMIAVERTVIDEPGSSEQAQLTLIDAQTGSAQRTLAPVPGTASTGATTALDWSPDGKTLALTLRHRSPDAEDDGVWLIDVKGG